MSTTNQSNSKVALATVLGTITSTFTTANTTIGMLNRKVSDAAQRQDIRSKLDHAIFKSTIHQTKSKELAESLLEVDEFLAKSDRHAELYKTAHAELALCIK